MSKVSQIRLFYLQKMELAIHSPLNSWTLLHDFQSYHYNNIAAHLYLLQQANTRLSVRCSNNLINHIIGDSRAIKDTLPLIFLRKYKKILIKYNMLYQEQFISSDGSSLCTWTQFRRRCFASHIKTQTPPKFFQELQGLIIGNTSHSAGPLAAYDHDTE